MNEVEIKAADAILKHASVDGVKFGVIRVYCQKAGITDEKVIKFAALHLQANKFIRIKPPTARLPQEVYEFELKAIEFKRGKKNYADYLQSLLEPKIEISKEAVSIPNRNPSAIPNPIPNSPTGAKQTIQVILQVIAIITAILLAMWANGVFK